MKIAGMVRRVDDLGRIVVPKEIRKNLKIKTGECLEIFLENEKIVLKKKELINNYSESLDNLLNIVSKLTGFSILLTDTDKVLYSIGENEYCNQEIGDDLINFIDKRNRITQTDFTLSNFEKANYLIQPLVINGDAVGSIIFCGNNKLDSSVTLCMDIINKFLINHLDV